MSIHKRLHDIHCMYYAEGGDIVLQGSDEGGEDFTVVIPTYEALQWFEKTSMKESLIKHINEL